MLSSALAGTRIKLRDGKVVTIVSEVLGIPAGPDIFGNWCFPVQISPERAGFVRLHEIVEIVEIVSTPTVKEAINARQDVQLDFRSTVARLNRRRIDRAQTQRKERHHNS